MCVVPAGRKRSASMPDPNLAYVAWARTGPPVRWMVKSGWESLWVVAVYCGWSLSLPGRVTERTFVNVPEEWTSNGGMVEVFGTVVFVYGGGSVW